MTSMVNPLKEDGFHMRDHTANFKFAPTLYDPKQQSFRFNLC